MAKRQELRLCGYGGQGIILAGYIIGQAASIYDGEYATFIQDYGPEARGGMCRADVVISDKPILYPYISAPSILVSMFQSAYDKYCPKNRKDAIVIIDSVLVKPTQQRGRKLLTIPATRMAENLGRANVANVVMLGFLTAVTNIVSLEAMHKSILASVPKHSEGLNMKAFERGYAYGLESLKSTKR